MYYKQNRPAIAMIELIFAMVIIGIVLMAAPQLISQAKKGGYIATQQEAIATLKSHMSFILSRHWDETNANQNDGITILNTTNAPIGLERDVNNRTRNVLPIGATNYRSFMDGANAFDANATPPEDLGLDDDDNAETDDIDDYDNTVTQLLNRAIEGTDNYIDNYIDKEMEIRTDVHYITDAPTQLDYHKSNNQLDYNGPFIEDAANSTHIKYVRVTLRDGTYNGARVEELNKQIILEAFSCNIGGFKANEFER